MAPPPDGLSPSAIPLPPVPQPAADTLSKKQAPEPLGGLGWLPAILFVAAFGFLLASFPARNNDLWAHLARGRQLARAGDLHALANNPLSPGTHSAWLYDLAVYGLYSLVGGGGLVLCKALLVAVLAVILLRLAVLGRPRSAWLPVTCTALALLAMSPRMLLQPATLSCFLLALTFWFLRPDADSDRSESRFRLLFPWPILIVIALWSNLDGWFVLGPAIVLLVLIGRGFDRLSTRQPLDLVSLSLSLLVSLALLVGACLLNPSFFDHPAAYLRHGGPLELRGLEPTNLSGPIAIVRMTSAAPFQSGYLTTLGLNPASLAYYPLLGLGLLSFLLNLPGWRWRWFLPWVSLAVLSAFDAKSIPFFAVLGGPVLAWNLVEFGRRKYAAEAKVEREPRFSVPILGPALCVAMLVAAWPGWLQMPPYEPRRWGIDTSVSLERGAAAVCRWHQDGKLPSTGRGLHLSSDSLNAFAWFCPEDNGLFDSWLALFLTGGVGDVSMDWAGRMHDLGVTHVVVHDPERRLVFALATMLGDPVEWPVLYLEGDLAIFGWRDPIRARGSTGVDFRPLELTPDRLDQLAFHPDQARKVPPPPPSPEAQIEKKGYVRYYWDALWKPAASQPIDRHEARLYLMLTDALRPQLVTPQLGAWEASQAAALVGAGAGWTGANGALDVQSRLVLFQPALPPPGTPADVAALDRLVTERCWPAFRFHFDTKPIAPLFLAIRAARRALAINPDDAQACYYLGECYLALLHDTRERVWAKQVQALEMLRRTQASWALNRAVALQPDLAPAHLALARLYEELSYRDLALHHLSTYLKLVRRAAPPPGVSAERFRAETSQYDEGLRLLSDEVDDRLAAFTAETSKRKLRVLDRANLAGDKGLKGKALEILLASDVAEFGSLGVDLELNLLLGAGRAQEVLDWSRDVQRGTLEPAFYHWVRAQASAALGDYAAAEDEMNLAANEGQRQLEASRREGIALALGNALLDMQRESGSLPCRLWMANNLGDLQAKISRLAGGLPREADLTVLRGVLLVEEGKIDEAEIAFRLALAFWKGESATDSGTFDFSGRVMAQGWLWLLDR